MTNSKVCGTVILYNTDSSVTDNIISYLYQLDWLIVIDNSTKQNHLIVEQIKNLQGLKYISNNSNLGIAEALNIAADLAIENGYHYLLTMDQDSRAPENMVNTLLEVALKNSNAGIVSPLHSNKYGTHFKFKKEIEEVNVVMTSGNLVSLDAYKKVGKFCEDYFIDYVDIEYCIRLMLSNYKIYRLNKVILEHNEANLTNKKILNRTFYPHNHKPFRLYYKTRNLLYLRRKYKDLVPDLLKIEYDSYLRTLAKIIIFEKQRLEKLKMIFLGLYDYAKAKKGRKF